MLKINRVRCFFFVLSQASCHKRGTKRKLRPYDEELNFMGTQNFLFISVTLVMKQKTSFSILYQAQNLPSLSFYLQIEIKFLKYVFRCLCNILLCTSSNIHTIILVGQIS